MGCYCHNAAEPVAVVKKIIYTPNLNLLIFFFNTFVFIFLKLFFLIFYIFFYRCTVHLDAITVLHLPTAALYISLINH